MSVDSPSIITPHSQRACISLTHGFTLRHMQLSSQIPAPSWDAFRVIRCKAAGENSRQRSRNTWRSAVSCLQDPLSHILQNLIRQNANMGDESYQGVL